MRWWSVYISSRVCEHPKTALMHTYNLPRYPLYTYIHNPNIYIDHPSVYVNPLTLFLLHR